MKKIYMCWVSLVLILTSTAKELEIAQGISLNLEEHDRFALPIYYKSQIVYVQNGSQRVLLKFRSDGEGGVRYDYISVVEGVKSEGNGHLIERYERKALKNGNFEAIDVGSKLWIKIAELRIEWSLGSENDGFLYFEGDGNRVHVFDKEYYDKIIFTQ